MTLKDIGSKIKELLFNAIPPIPSYPQQVQQNFQRLNPLTQFKNILSTPVPSAITGFPYNITRPQEYRAGQLAVKPTDKRTVGQYLIGGQGQYGIPSRQQIASGIESALMAYPPVSAPVQFTKGLSLSQRLKQALPTAGVMAGITGGLKVLRGEKVTPEELLASGALGMMFGGVQAVSKTKKLPNIKIKPSGIKPEVKPIPKELEPFAVEARKFKTAKEFDEEVRITPTILGQLRDFVGNRIAELTKKYPDLSFSSRLVTDFYNQVTQPIKIKGKKGLEVLPEIPESTINIRAKSPLSQNQNILRSDTSEQLYPKSSMLKKADELMQKGQEALIEARMKAEIAQEERLLYNNNILKNDINSIKKKARSRAFAEGDIETLRKKDPQLVERVTEAVREVKGDISDEEALNIALSIPSKAETMVKTPYEIMEARRLIREAKTLHDKVYHAEATEQTLAKVKQKQQIDFDRASEQEYKEWIKSFSKRENLRTTNQAIKDLTKEMEQSTLLGQVKDSDNWKDKAKLLYVRETMERNFEDVMGKDALAMKEKYLDPIYKATANETRFMNKERADIKNLGIEPGSRDSAILQDYGEGMIPRNQVSEKIIKAESVLRQKYNQYLEMINKALTRNGYDPIPKRKDYFRHFQDLGTVFDRFGIPAKAEDLPTDINGLTADFRPGKNFFSAQLQRKGGAYTSDAIRGIDSYLEGASKQIFRTDAIQGLRSLDKALRTKYTGKQNLTNFVSDLTEYTNILAGKKAMLDRAVESLAGRSVYNAANVLRSQTSANMVGANISSALTNYIPLTQSLATTGKVNFLRGIMDTISNIFKNDGFINRSDFLTSRIGSDPLYLTNWQKIQKTGGLLFKYIDHFTSQVVTRSKYLDGISKGLSEEQAMKQADAWARKMIAGRSAGEMPTMFSTRTLGAFTQFQLEVNNQLSFAFKDIPRNFSTAGAISAISQLFLYSYIFNNFFEKLTGRRPALDPLGIIQQAYEDYTNENIKEGQATKNLTRNILDQLPFTSIATGGRIPMGAAIPDPLAVLRGESDIKKEMIKLTYLLPPTGGGQTKKTIEGLTAYQNQAALSPSGRVRFPIPQTLENRIRTTLFGQYSTPEARQYFREGRSVLGSKQSEIFKQINDKQEYYQNIIEERYRKKQIDQLKAQAEQGNFQQVGNLVPVKTKSGIRVIDLSFQPVPPTLTGSTELDKKAVSRFNSDISKKGNDIYDLQQAGKLSSHDAEAQLKALRELKNKFKSGTKKPKKITIKKISAPKAIKIKKLPKINLKSTIKIAKPPKLAKFKIKKLTISRGKTIKIKKANTKLKV